MKTKASTAKAPARDVFTAICKADLGVEVVKEYTFHPTRKWRFDYAMPAYKIALEVEGGIYNSAHGRHAGRHTSVKGFLGDIEKYNEAALLGWRVFRTTPGELHKTKTVNLIKEAIKSGESHFLPQKTLTM